MRSKNKIDFLKLLNYNLSYNPVFEKLFEKTSKILDEHIGEPYSQLSRIRSSKHVFRGDYLDVDTPDGVERGKIAHVKEVVIDGEPYAEITVGLGNGSSIRVTRRVLQDRKTLINSAALAGVDYYSDYITDIEYARIVDYAGKYWKNQTSGTRDFVDFIGFIKDMKLSLIPLWTKDQGDFATSDDPIYNFYEYLISEDEVTNPVILNGDESSGDEYLTSHVDMEYDVIASPNVLFHDLINLFYYFAPIHLVLYRIIGAINVNVETYAELKPHVDSVLHSNYTWKAETSIDLALAAPTPHIDNYINSYLFLNNDYYEIDPYYNPLTPIPPLYPVIKSRYAKYNGSGNVNVKSRLHFIRSANYFGKGALAFKYNRDALYEGQGTVWQKYVFSTNMAYKGTGSFESSYIYDKLLEVNYVGRGTYWGTRLHELLSYYSGQGSYSVTAKSDTKRSVYFAGEATYQSESNKQYTIHVNFVGEGFYDAYSRYQLVLQSHYEGIGTFVVEEPGDICSFDDGFDYGFETCEEICTTGGFSKGFNKGYKIPICEFKIGEFDCSFDSSFKIICKPPLGEFGDDFDDDFNN